VLVGTDLQGRASVWELLRQLIDFARADGVKQMEGLILSENKKMLTLCREFGFSVARRPSDQRLMLPTLNLQPT
jgi:acetyltransferase